MEASSTVVIKVKYGDMLRRFSAPIVENKLFVNMNGLREKILSLFNFAPDTDLMLTYVDEDGDVVALVDDDDLRDVVKQGLNPVRVTMKVNNDKNGNQTYSNVSSTPLSLPAVQPLPNLSAGVSERLRNVPEPLRAALAKVSEELSSKASSSSFGIADIVDTMTKFRLSYSGQRLDSAVISNVDSGVPEGSSATDNKDSEPLNVAATLKKTKPDACMERSEVKIQNVTGPRKVSPTFDFNAVAAALESENVSGSKPESGGVPHTVRRREKVKKNVECSNGKPHVTSNPPAVANNVEKVAEHGSNPHDGSSDLMYVDHVTDNQKSAVIDAFKKATSPTWSPYIGGVNLGSLRGHSGMYDKCPFSGTSLDNILGAPPHSASDENPFRISHSQNDSSGSIFHRGVRCDGCGIHPIVGPRFKSKVKVDYDLCSVCYDKMGNDNDYVRMERPAVYRHHLPHFRVRDHGATIPHVYRGSKVKLGAANLDSRFVQDVNIFDGTVMAPLTPFTKIWRMRNNGTVAWPQKTQLVWVGGDKLIDTHSMEVQISAAGLQLGQELDVAVDFISPELPGRYISYWRMASPSGQKFGQCVWVLIQVDASTIKESPRDTVRDLNLNLPPASSSLTGLEIFDGDSVAVAEASRHKAGNSKKIVESGLLNTENELKFPINDNLLVGNGAGSSSAPSSASSSAQYPIINLTDMEPPLPLASPAIPLPSPPPRAPPVPSASPAMPITMPPPPPPAAHIAKLMEDKLLRELEEMGFKQVDLNKEVLRMNEYDLEQAVDDLCGVAEWDPILEELEEMGFRNTEMNKKLLKKNNGSIKRVVMDLIAGEEDA